MQSVLKLLLILAERVTEIELTVVKQVKQQRDEICMSRVHRGSQGAPGEGERRVQFTQVTPT